MKINNVHNPFLHVVEVIWRFNMDMTINTAKWRLIRPCWCWPY